MHEKVFCPGLQALRLWEYLKILKLYVSSCLFFSIYLLLSCVISLTYCMRTFHREERRVQKWRKMIGVGGSDWKHYIRRKPLVVKRRVRKGIPDCLRGLVWQLISGSRDLLLMNPGVYEVIFTPPPSGKSVNLRSDQWFTFGFWVILMD